MEDLKELRRLAEIVASHEPDFKDIHEYLEALRNMQGELSGTTVLALLSRLEQAEKNADTYQTLYEQRAESLEQAEQAIQRVREVHRPVSDPFGVSCAACIGDSRRSPYPCDTIRALDGDGRG